MMTFAQLSALDRAIYALWALLLCLVNIGSALLATVRKRLAFAAVALALLLASYLLWQVIFDLSLFGMTAGATLVSRALGSLPWWGWLLALDLLTLGAGVLLARNIKYDQTFITPGAIKAYLDKVPCGVCCWRESGRVLFSNLCMNRLCVALTGAPLLNGDQFRGAVPTGMVTVEGRVWRFSCREFSLDGEMLHEMVAADVTTEYARTQALERDKAELSQLNEELREYYLSMDETIRRREILQAKVNIHDEMNRLMLSTMAAHGEDPAQLDRIFSLWERNALLLCMEADSGVETRAAGDLEKLASALRLRLLWQSPLPASLTGEGRSLFYSAAQEAMINAVKHAGAQTLNISFDEGEESLTCRFTNDGVAPTGPVRFTGGLANLSALARRQGAQVWTEAGEGFTLAIKFCKNQPSG